MYMDSQHWDTENRMPYETPLNHKMSPAPSSGAQNKTSLPPLHQAIPEFHSHNPLERRSSSVPRSLSDRGSPSYNHQRVSPHRGGESGEVYDAQQVKFPGAARENGYPPSPSSYSRPGSYLPPVSSLASSRGSSLDAEGDRAERGPHSYGSQHPSYGAGYEHEGPRGQSHPQEYQRYHPSHNNYRSTSPVNQYPQAGYYSHSGTYAQQPARSNSGRDSRQPSLTGGGRSPFSAAGGGGGGGQPVDLAMDHFDQDRVGSKRRRGNLPKQVTDLLRAWLNEHIHHPYPTEDEKQMLMAQTGLTIHQISNWFINARRRRVPAITSSDSSKPRRPS